MAIVNPAQITPYTDISLLERELAEDLIFNRGSDALQKLIEYFQKTGESTKVKSTNQQTALASSPWKAGSTIVSCIELKKMLKRILMKSWISQPVVKKQTWLWIFSTIPCCLPMKEVGDKFGSGELILPFVLQSAEVMKKSVSYLENYLERKEGVAKGTIVLATVYGDVHDIGKNLVKTILSNNGYQVVDLGKQVPAETIISKAVEINANCHWPQCSSRLYQ